MYALGYRSSSAWTAAFAITAGMTWLARYEGVFVGKARNLAERGHSRFALASQQR